MNIENSFWRIAPEFGSTSLREQLLDSLKTGKEYRQAFVEESIRSGLAAQIKTIREQLPHPQGLERPMTQVEFAALLGKSQSWVSRLEDPNEAAPTIPTLLRIANKLDIGLQVRLVSFSKLLDDAERVSPETLNAAPFARDPVLFPGIGVRSQGTLRALASDLVGSQRTLEIPRGSVSRENVRIIHEHRRSA